MNPDNCKERKKNSGDLMKGEFTQEKSNYQLLEK